MKQILVVAIADYFTQFAFGIFFAVYGVIGMVRYVDAPEIDGAKSIVSVMHGGVVPLAGTVFGIALICYALLRAWGDIIALSQRMAKDDMSDE